MPGLVNPTAIRSGHIDVSPDRQAGQRRHGKLGSMTTRSPIRAGATPTPAATTSPNASCPGTQGAAGGRR